MPDSVLTVLADTSETLTRLLPSLETAARVPASRRPGPGSRGAPGSRPPWNTGPAYVLLDIHYGARALETDLRYVTAGVLRERGGSGSNTVRALVSIVSLAGGVPFAQQDAARRQVTAWLWRGRIALGESEPIQHVPRETGQPAPRCPWCRFPSLRMRPLAGLVFCINPDCADGDGRHPVARIEVGAGFGEPLLVWQDESVGLAA